MSANDDLTGRYNPHVAAALPTATRFAPYPAHLGMEVVETGPGFLVAELPCTAQLFNGVGTLHGGAIVSLIDHVLSLTVYPLVEVGKWVATLEFKVSYLAPVREGKLTARGEVLSLRRTMATVRVDVRNQDRLVATGLGTLYIRDKLPASGGG
jgi:uncharacterized protein (TIGR00369 family)